MVSMQLCHLVPLVRRIFVSLRQWLGSMRHWYVLMRNVFENIGLQVEWFHNVLLLVIFLIFKTPTNQIRYCLELLRMVRFLNPSLYRGTLFGVRSLVNRKAGDLIIFLFFFLFSLGNRRLL